MEMRKLYTNEEVQSHLDEIGNILDEIGISIQAKHRLMLVISDAVHRRAEKAKQSLLKPHS